MRPILFEIPGLGWSVQSYGVAIAGALLLAWLISLAVARQDGLPSERLGMNFVVAAAAGLLGARALWLAQHPTVGGSLWSLSAGGMSVMGGVAAALVVTTLACVRQRIPTFAWLDAVAPGFAVGVIVEALGAFLAGSSFGRYVAAEDFGYAFAVRYPAGTPVHDYHQHLMAGLPTLTPELSAPVHPVQLYGAVIGLAILGLALAIRRRRGFPGEVALAVLAAYVVGRWIILDPLRFDASPRIFGSLRLGMISALGLLGILGLMARFLRGRAAASAGDPGG